MSATDFPPVSELVPHSGALVLLDRVLEAGDDYLLASLTVRADGLYNHGDRVPAWVGMEYMGQAIAACAGLRARRHGDAIQPGFLLGTRRYLPTCPDFTVGATLTVRATRLLGDEAGMAVFKCELNEDGETLVSARLNVYQPPHDGREEPRQ